MTPLSPSFSEEPQLDQSITMLATSSRILLRTATGIGGKTAIRALVARAGNSAAYSTLGANVSFSNLLVNSRRVIYQRQRIQSTMGILRTSCLQSLFLNVVYLFSLDPISSRIETILTLQIRIPQSHYQSDKRINQQVAHKSAVATEEEPIRGNYNSSVTFHGVDACSKAGIDSLGINGPSTIYKNQTFE